MQSEKKIDDELAISRSSLFYSIDQDDRKAYERFCELKVSHGMNAMLGIVFTAITWYMYLMSVMNSNGGVFMTVVVAIGGLVLNPLLLFLVFCQFLSGTRNVPWLLKGFEPYFIISMNFVTALHSIILGLYLISRIVNGRCESLDQFHRWSCNSEYDVEALPQGTLLILMMLPFMFSIAFKTVRSTFILIVWFYVVASVVISIAIAKSYYSIPVLLFYVPLSLACILEVHRQNINQFLMLKKQHHLLEANCRLAEENQNELRFMIANMAHDLKTPLSAFMNGVETLSAIITDLAKSEAAASQSGNGSKTHSSTGVLLSSAKESLTNLFTVNSFMTMTVNRCIDYMKASKGIKLEPRMETINLSEVLSMPVRTMRDLQSRIAIVQSPIPAGVCSHIITDLQWLQENLFCLISNAVKYSSHGHITVSMSLIKDTDSALAAAKPKRSSPPPPPSCNSSDGGSPTHAGAPLAPEKYAFLDRMTPQDSKRTEFVDLELGEQVIFDGSLKISPRKVKPERLTKYGIVRTASNDEPKQPVECATGATVEAEMLLIEVEDTGIGLSDEVKVSLFTPFRQAQRRAGGTGLGLYSLAKRVDALGGYYGVRNRSDGEQGSVFWFAIPYRPDLSAGNSMSQSSNSTEKLSSVDLKVADLPPLVADEAKPGFASPESVPMSPLSSVTETTARPRVMVVDDSLTIQKMTGHLLKRNGYLVDQEENGANALEALERARQAGVVYDVILIDLNMPVVDGLEMMKRLRELEKLRNAEKVVGNGGGVGSSSVVLEHQRVFAFSANSDSSTMKEAMDAGADDFVSKPFSQQTFKEKLERCVL